ncbi:MAG: DUF72 domain-containing protein [candidate division Zixibacteria bacterium]|nr:DUF72 domain-containing protein [candidate division Zixibacteria bacterium]MDD5427534.1 DUF72 domain-containing protein [candidate division Zixibacteria bacterium]
MGVFYPLGTSPSDFLTYYAQQFNTVEIDATYYAIPGPKTVDNWVKKTPENFIFAAKFPRSIVHGGKNNQPDPNVILKPEAVYKQRDMFLDVMRRLGDRRGPLLLQFPYFSKETYRSKEAFYELLDNFLDDLPDDFHYAVEIRNRLWLTEGFKKLLRKHHCALTLVDHAWMPHGDEIAMKLDPFTTTFTYLRLLGDRREIEAVTKKWDKEVIDRGERLTRWVNLISKIKERQLKAFVYINNHYAGHAPATARRLEKMLLALNL